MSPCHALVWLKLLLLAATTHSKPSNTTYMECRFFNESVCAKITRDHGEPLYLIIINECELKQLRRHQGPRVTTVPMESCGSKPTQHQTKILHDKTGARLKRHVSKDRQKSLRSIMPAGKLKNNPKLVMWKLDLAKRNNTESLHTTDENGKPFKLTQAPKRMPYKPDPQKPFEYQNLYPDSSRSNEKIHIVGSKEAASGESYPDLLDTEPRHSTDENGKPFKLTQAPKVRPFKPDPEKPVEHQDLYPDSSRSNEKGRIVSLKEPTSAEYEEKIVVLQGFDDSDEPTTDKNKDTKPPHSSIENGKPFKLTQAPKVRPYKPDPEKPLEHQDLYPDSPRSNEKGNIVGLDEPTPGDSYPDLLVSQGTTEAVCPTECPSRDVMVCSKNRAGVYRTFLSVCHMRMYGCQHPDEYINLVARKPCIMSAPFTVDDTKVKGAAKDDENDIVLEYIYMRHLGILANNKLWSGGRIDFSNIGSIWGSNFNFNQGDTSNSNSNVAQGGSSSNLNVAPVAPRPQYPGCCGGYIVMG